VQLYTLKHDGQEAKGLEPIERSRRAAAPRFGDKEIDRGLYRHCRLSRMRGTRGAGRHSRGLATSSARRWLARSAPGRSRRLHSTARIYGHDRDDLRSTGCAGEEFASILRSLAIDGQAPAAGSAAARRGAGLQWRSGCRGGGCR